MISLGPDNPHSHSKFTT